MKRLMTRFALLAGMVMLVGAAASAQDLRGKVPFAFNAAGATLPAGEYQITRQHSTVPVWIVRNLDTRQQVLLMSPVSARRDVVGRGAAALTFLCSGESCALNALYTPGNAFGYGFKVAPAVVPDVRVAALRTVTIGD